MGFVDYAKRERVIQTTENLRYRLLNSTWRERTGIGSSKENLASICQGHMQNQLFHCRAAYSSKVECDNLSEKKDKNGFFLCMYGSKNGVFSLDVKLEDEGTVAFIRLGLNPFE